MNAMIGINPMMATMMGRKTNEPKKGDDKI
jgi:hypothetical protein